ncbi:hypothetical protein [[Eubacterium] cellulosolvens]
MASVFSMVKKGKVLEEITHFNPKASSADPKEFVDNSIIDELEREGFFTSF